MASQTRKPRVNQVHDRQLAHLDSVVRAWINNNEQERFPFFRQYNLPVLISPQPKQFSSTYSVLPAPLAGEFELSFCVVYTNNCRKKSSTHFRQRCFAFFALAKIDNWDDTKRLQYHLQIIHRQLGDSPEQVRFRDLVRHASQGGLSREEWEFLDSRTERKLTSEVRKLFDNAACLYTTRNDVNDLNLTELQALNQPCARINTRHDGGSDAAKAPPDKAGGLEFRIVLAKHAKVMITRNIWQNQCV
jgi:hypothetical protein